MELVTAVLGSLNLFLCLPAVFLFVCLGGVGVVSGTGTSAVGTGAVSFWTVGTLSSGQAGSALVWGVGSGPSEGTGAVFVHSLGRINTSSSSELPSSSAALLESKYLGSVLSPSVPCVD